MHAIMISRHYDINNAIINYFSYKEMAIRFIISNEYIKLLIFITAIVTFNRYKYSMSAPIVLKLIYGYLLILWRVSLVTFFN